MEGAEHIVTWASATLCSWPIPMSTTSKYKKWRMSDLPIVPEHFKLVVRDERSKKQMNVVKRRSTVTTSILCQRLRRRP